MTVPHLYRCPISLDLFTDPVTLCTGQTYDRPNIEKWFASGNLTCPVTMQKLQDPSIVPNHTLRHLINQWLEMCQQIDPNFLETIDSDHFLVKLKKDLESPETEFCVKLQAIEKVRLLITRESPSKSPCFLRLGFLPLLLELVFGNVELRFSSDQVEFVEKALVCALKLLGLGELEPLNMLKDKPKLEAFVCQFQNGSNLIKISLCQLVETISTASETKELCCMLAENTQILNQMILLLHLNSEVSDISVKALSSLSRSAGPTIQDDSILEGLVDGLITYIISADRREKSLPSLAVAILERTLVHQKAKDAILDQPNGINALVKMVFRVSDHEGSENAVNSLMILCHDSLAAREEAVCARVVTQLLLLLQSQCSNMTKTKARMLLKLLR